MSARSDSDAAAQQTDNKHTTIASPPKAWPPLAVIPKGQLPDTAQCQLPDTAPGISQIGSSENGNLALNPDFTFIRRDYRVRLATEKNQLHARASKLVTSMYGSRGLATTGATVADSQPKQVTLAASSGHHVFGTLTLGLDSGAGLMADSLYRPEIDKLRAKGHRLCEVTRLALDPGLSCPEVMATIFNVAFILAGEVHARTDLLAEVHPRHAGFYRRTMGYRIVGPERICHRVSAPAVLMHLCLNFAQNQIHQLAGTCAQGERSLYRLFLTAAEQETLRQRLIAPVPVNA